MANPPRTDKLLAELTLAVTQELREKVKSAVMEAIDRVFEDDTYVPSAPKKRGGKVVRWTFLSAKTRRLPEFVIDQTRCKTKVDLAKKFAEGTVFEVGKDPVRPPK